MHIIPSTTQTVTGSRHSETERVSVSARPQITFVEPEIDSVPRMNVGYNTKFYVQGYNFDTAVELYISSNGNTFSNSYTAITGYNIFATVPNLSSVYPLFTGFKIPLDDYHVTSPNTLWVLLSAAQGVGKVDLIISNPAGYGRLYLDFTTRIINIVS